MSREIWRMLGDLERRVKGLEARRGRPMSETRKIDEAQKWIIEYLKKKKYRVESKSLEHLPPRSELVHIILRDGRKAGFSPQIVRSARLELNVEMERVALARVPNTRLWMWRLV